MKSLDVKVALVKSRTIFARVDEELWNKIEVLVRKHKVNRSAVIVSLLEAGLRSLK